MFSAAGIGQAGAGAAGAIASYYGARSEAKANKAEIKRAKLELMVNDAIETLDEREELATWQGTARAMAAASGVEMSGSIKDRVIRASVDSEKALSRKRLNLNRKMSELERLHRQQDKNLRAAAISTMLQLGQSALSFAGGV